MKSFSNKRLYHTSEAHQWTSVSLLRCSEKRFTHFDRLKTTYKSYKIRMGDQVEVLPKENNKLKERIYDIIKDFKSLKHRDAVKPRVKKSARG